MTEMMKTTIFIGAAIVTVLLGFVFRPTSETENVEELVGQHLNEFEVSDISRMRIIRFDADTASTREFEVAEDDSLWTIPSKQGYPADATRQMAEAATTMIDREILRIAARDASQHEALGVINPSSSRLDITVEGVGTRVVLTDSEGDTLTDMIIGKRVKDAEGQYYIRRTDQDIVYVVSLEPEKLSTDFQDWIEHDLLKLTAMDIAKIDIKDYSAQMQMVLAGGGFQPRIDIDRRGEYLLRYDEEQSKWEPIELLEFVTAQNELVPFELGENEVLNQENLRELSNGLDDLQIVDVERKPAGLSSDLKAGEGFLKNQDAALSLAERGFVPTAVDEQGIPEILSSEGEVICSMKDGVEYVLRFGNLQMEGEGGSSNTGEDGMQQDSGIHRYLFVMVRFNEEMIEKPELQGLPELPAGAETEALNDEAPTDEAPTDEAPTDETPTDETEPNESEADKTEEQSELEEILARRKEIETENQRRLDAYQDKIAEGKEHVQELNEHFGDWYYVIANEMYKKIHLGRDELIKQADAEEEQAEGTPPQDSGVPGLPDIPGLEALQPAPEGGEEAVEPQE